MEARLTRNTRIVLLVLAYLVLVLFAGLRWETGNDWFNYYNYYDSLSRTDNPNTSFEIGYQLASVIMSRSGLSYSGFLLIWSSLYLGIFFLNFGEENLRIAGWIVLQFYSAYLLGLMGTSRQVMAIALCLFSVRYLLTRNWLRFVICVAVATAFHTTALCFLLAWPLSRIKLKLLYVWLALGALFVAAALNAGALLVRSAGNLLNISYLDQKIAAFEGLTGSDLNLAGGDLTLFFYAKRLIFLVVFLLLFRFFSEERDQLYFKLYFFSMVIFVLFFSTDAVLAMRAGLYFQIFELFLLALLTRRIKVPAWRGAFCVFLICLSLSRLWTTIFLNNPKVFVPYKGLLINQDTPRDPSWF